MQQNILNEIFKDQPLTRAGCPPKSVHSCHCKKCNDQKKNGFRPEDSSQQKNFMSSILSELFLESEGGSGATKTASTPKRVKTFLCSTSDFGKVKTILPSATNASLRAVVESAAATALSWIYTAIGTLRISPRSTTTITNFKKAFAQNPDWNPSWKTSKMKWIDWGDLIAYRIEKAAKIINGGWIKYNCSESDTHCPECKGIATYWACSSFKGKYVICLGKDFWTAHKNGDKDQLALTLLHEALHIYFGKTVAHTGQSGNAYCYERYILTANKRPLPAVVTTNCP